MTEKMLQTEYDVEPNTGDPASDAIKLPKGPIADYLPLHTVSAENIRDRFNAVDAVVLYEGNTVVHRDPETNEALHRRPTTFVDSDPYGTLGGSARTFAAALAAHQGIAKSILIVGGNPDKKSLSHNDRHSGAEIYEASFFKRLERLIDSKIAEPQNEILKRDVVIPDTLISDTSENSYWDIVSAFENAVKHGWKSVGFLSNSYHLPRLQALGELAKKNHAPRFDLITIFPLSAEETIIGLSKSDARPRYEDFFRRAYTTHSMLMRIANEQKGCLDVQEGRYVPDGKSKTALSNK